VARNQDSKSVTYLFLSTVLETDLNHTC